MKLYTNEGSPFSRKVRILAREKGLRDSIEEVATAVSPVSDNESLASSNPLAKIPVLVLDDGETLFDSGVICEYLDSLHQGALAFPPPGYQRVLALRQQALCDGILDAAVSCRYEQALRPEKHRWIDWVQGQKMKISRGLAILEEEAQSWSDEFEMPQIGTVCVLGYLDFRFPDWGWRDAHPRLAAWYDATSMRPSVVATAPPPPAKT